MPLSLFPRGVLLLCFLACFGWLAAQTNAVLVAQGTTDSIAIAGYGHEAGVGPTVLEAVWTGINGGRGTFRYVAHGVPPATVDLSDLLVAGIDQYLDQHIHFTRDGVQTDKPVAAIATGMDRMIAAAIAHFGGPAVQLSTATRQQLARICSIDWSRASFGVDGGEDQEKYMAIYYYVNAQRNELERDLRNDLAPVQGWLIGGQEATGTGQTEVQVPTVCATVFDEDNYLCALDLRADSVLNTADVDLTDAMLSVIAQKAETLAKPAPGVKLRKRDRWLKAELDLINHRLDEVDQRKELWALRDRMDDLEGRLDDIGLQVDELEKNRQRPRVEGNAVAALSVLTGKDLNIHFNVGSAVLGPQQKALLDEVARAMAQDGQGRVLLTGQADPSGNPGMNMLLSEERAKAVRNYLIARGTPDGRVLLNYSGARQGSGGTPAERRVVLEWIP